MFSSLFSAASGILGGGDSGNPVSDALGGGQSDQSKSAAQAGSFGGGLNITKTDNTLTFALIIGGVLLAIVLLKGGKK